MRTKGLKYIDDVSFEKECLLRIMANAETQRRERNCSVEANAFVFALGFLPLQAVYNQEI